MAPPPVGAPPVAAPPVVVPSAAVTSARELSVTGLTARLNAIADSILQSPENAGATHAFYAVDLADGTILLNRNADKLLIPASNLKLITAATSLETLGSDYRWHTSVLIRGEIIGGVLAGDLVLIGSGDPTWSDSMHTGGSLSAFAPIVESLKARGISRIRGGVLAEGDAFPGPTIGKGWEAGDLDAAYGAAVDELLLNNGFLTLKVTAGRTAGAPLNASTLPVRDYPPVEVNGTTGTAAAAGPLRAAYDSTGTRLIVTGALAPGVTARFNIAYRHPNDAVRHALAQYLRDNGIEVGGATPPAEAGHPGSVADTLAVLESAPLREVLPQMLKASQNQIAEAVFHTAGLVGTGVGSADSAAASVRRALGKLGIDTTSLAIVDGSGLSRRNLVSARAVAALLQAVSKQPYFDDFKGALPIAGRDGTLSSRMRSDPLRDNVFAKTGSMGHVRALSGYTVTPDGRKVAFSFIANNFLHPTSATDRLHEFILSTLANGK